MFRTFGFVTRRPDGQKKKSTHHNYRLVLANSTIESSSLSANKWLRYRLKLNIFEEIEKSSKKQVFPKNDAFCIGLGSWFFYMLSASGFYTTYIFFRFPAPIAAMGVWKNPTKPHFGAFPELWRHKKKKFFVLISKSAYRSNETFFSRTHSLGCRHL